MKIVSLKDAISQAKKLAESRLAKGTSADEFVKIGDADGFRILGNIIDFIQYALETMLAATSALLVVFLASTPRLKAKPLLPTTHVP